jgi:asparagine synthase (glutamine-hydrolysing)
VLALLAESGQRDLMTFSIGFESAGGESGDEFEYSDVVARRFETTHHRIMIDTSRLLPALDGAVAAMSEPMVSHDCVAFYLLSEEVSREVKVVQSGHGADEVLGGYDWYPPLLDVPRADAVEAYAQVFFDRRHARWASCYSRTGTSLTTWPRSSWSSDSAPRAPTRPSTPPCATTPRSCWSTIRSSASTT